MAKGKYTETLNLLDSPFSMRGDLANREPRMLDAWKEKTFTPKCVKRRAGGKSLSSMTGRHTPTAIYILVTR